MEQKSFIPQQNSIYTLVSLAVVNCLISGRTGFLKQTRALDAETPGASNWSLLAPRRPRSPAQGLSGPCVCKGGGLYLLQVD